MIKNSVYRIYFARCMNIFNSLLAQLVKYDVHTTRKINSIHAIFFHILSFYFRQQSSVVTEILTEQNKTQNTSSQLRTQNIMNRAYTSDVSPFWNLCHVITWQTRWQCLPIDNKRVSWSCNSLLFYYLLVGLAGQAGIVWSGVCPRVCVCVSEKNYWSEIT